jgi:chromosome segregation ATPase
MIKIRSVRKTKKRSKNVIKNKTYRNKWCGVGGVLFSLGSKPQTQQKQQMQQMQQMISEKIKTFNETIREPQEKKINGIIEEIKKLNRDISSLSLELAFNDIKHENMNAKLEEKLEEENHKLSLMIREKNARIAQLEESNAAAAAAADISRKSSNILTGIVSSVSSFASGRSTETEQADKVREINDRTIANIKIEIRGLEAEIEKNNDKRKIEITQSSEEIRKKNELDAKLSDLGAQVNIKKAELKNAKDHLEKIEREFVIWLANKRHKADFGGRRRTIWRRRRSNKSRNIRRTRRKLL